MYLTLGLPFIFFPLSFYFSLLTFPTSISPLLLTSPHLYLFLLLATLITICYLLSFHHVLHIRREAADEGRDQRCQYLVLEVWFDADEEESIGCGAWVEEKWGYGEEWREEYIGKWVECAVGYDDWEDRCSIKYAEWIV
jgi:hypothetical protein